MAFLVRIFPFLAWFKDFKGSSLRADLISGVTVALVLIPQSMAYAQLAGLPAYYGLYAAFLPPMVASLFGSSNQLATGPVAVVSLMTAATLEPLATSGSAEYVAYAILLALLVGTFQFALGVMRLGLIVNFLSHPVVNGFTNAAALIIATSQLSKIFGVYVDKADYHYETIFRVVAAAIDYTHWPTLAMAALAFAIMITLKKLVPKVPNVLLAVVVTTALAWAVSFEHNEKVPLERIESEEARELLGEFNLAVTRRQDMERLRTEANVALDGQEREDGSDRRDCTGCHAARDLSEVGKGESRITPAGALALHHMAGLVDLHVKNIKGDVSRIRTRLRQMKFEAARSAGGQLEFFPLGQVPEGLRGDGGTWRIKVGTRPLDPGAVTMLGSGAVVANIPEGLPALAFPDIDWNAVPRLFFMAMVISLLGFMEAISIAKAMAARTGQRLDPNQELVGQGLANIIGCIGQSYPVSGSFSRSAVNLQAGARTGLSNVFSSAVVVLVLLFFTPLLYNLPQAVLAAIIMMAVFGLLNIKGFVHAWKAQRFDGVVGIASFLGTLVFAPHLEWGIAIGVLLSLGAYLFRSMKPRVAELSLHPDGSLRDAERHHLDRCKYIAAIRFDGPLNFASTSYLEDEVLRSVSEMPHLKHVLIAAHGINEIDASGEEMLDGLVRRLREAGYEISFSGLNDDVQDVLIRTLLYDKIGPENIYPTQLLAVASIHARAHRGVSEPDCPFQSMRPHVVDLSMHPDGSLRDAKRHSLALCKHIAAIRFDGVLDLASSKFLEEHVDRRISAMPGLKCVFFAAHGINRMGVHGLEMFEKLVARLREQGFRVSFSGLKDEVLDELQKTHLYNTIGGEHMYPTQAMAIEAIHAAAHEGSDEQACPLDQVVERDID